MTIRSPIHLFRPTTGFLVAACLLAPSLSAAFAYFQEWKSGVDWREPTIINPGDAAAAPSDAIVLFGGDDLSQWNGVENWTFEEDYGVVGSNITSKQGFGDCQLHLEFATPQEVVGQGQGRGNSGVYFMGRYEVQILDSYENTTYYDGQCGAIYKQRPPLVNASRPPGEWQTYDIIFTAPRFCADGQLTSPGYVTVLHNGVLVQNHYRLQGNTFYTAPPSYDAHGLREPLMLQFHGNPVRFRNIWIRDLMPQETGSRASAELQTQDAS